MTELLDQHPVTPSEGETRFHRPMVELLDDPAFLADIAERAGVAPRSVRGSILRAAAHGHFDLTITGPCTCAACRAGGRP